MTYKNSTILGFLVVFITLPLSAQDSKWKSLFDGKTLDGWTQKGGKAKYSVENGTIVGHTVPKTPNSFLCTEKHYGNFVLELEFKVHPELNSGVQIRSNSLKDYKKGRVHGYQVEIDPSDRAYTAGIYDEGRRGWLFDLKNNRAARYAFKQNQWNKFRVEAIDNRIRTWLNGVPAADLKDGMTKTGFIGLQVHGVGNRQDSISVAWRNIRIQENPQPSPEVKKPDYSKHPAKIFAPDAKFEKLAGGFRFTEGPAVGPDGKIYFSDIPTSRGLVYDPQTNQTTVFRKSTGRTNGMFWTASDALICCEGGNRRLTRILGDSTKVLAEKFKGKKLNSPNDIVPDAVGGFYFTDPRYGKRDNLELDVEAVYYVPRRGKLMQIETDIPRPNGIILSPDNKTLYVADTGKNDIWAFDVVGPGKLKNKRKFADVGSDGMSMDVYGNVYLTSAGSIVVYSAEGKEIARVKPPESPANCVLVGSTLYVTARTGFYKIETNSQGLE